MTTENNTREPNSRKSVILDDEDPKIIFDDDADAFEIADDEAVRSQLLSDVNASTSTLWSLPRLILASLVVLAVLWIAIQVEEIYINFAAQNIVITILQATAAALVTLALLTAAWHSYRYRAFARINRRISQRWTDLGDNPPIDSSDPTYSHDVRQLLRDTAKHLQAINGTYAERRRLGEILNMVADGRVLLAAGETALAYRLDEIVYQKISDSSARVASVSALSPRPIFEVIFAVWELFRLTAGIAAIYGYHGNYFSTLSMMKSVLSYMTSIGTLAISENIIGQLTSHGIASKISGRLGQAALSGYATIRFGLAAMACLQPIPFTTRTPKSTAWFITRLGKVLPTDETPPNRK